MKLRILLIILFLTFGNFYPQEKDSLPEVAEIKYDEETGLSPVEFDQKRIEDYRSQEEFDYINALEKDNWWTRFKKWLNAKYNQIIAWLFGDYKAGSFLAVIIKILPYLLIFIFLGLIVWLFSRLNPGSHMLRSQKQNEVFLSEEEELVKNEDLLALGKVAVNKGEFRLAVRYYYLNALKKLDELRIIDYQFQKTNKEYREEIDNSRIKKEFSEITNLYEFIWYGNFNVSESDFKLAEKGFSRMNETLKSAGNE